MARWKELQAAICGMHGGRFVLDLLESYHRSSVTGLKEQPSMMKHRGISQTTVNNLAEVCRKYGITDCVWMKEVRVKVRSPLHDEILAAVPLKESEVDWNELVTCFDGPEIRDSAIKVEFIKNMRKSGNVRSRVSAVMPPQIHRSLYKTLISRMNQRLYHLGSTYRLKFEPVDTGYVQVAAVAPVS